MKKQITDNQIRAEKFNALKKEALELLKKMATEIKNDKPTNINWGHIGSMAHVVSELKDTANFL